jgi:hypothetical protein
MPRRDGLRIGIDLDNTLINYDRLFHKVSVERLLVPADFAGTKRDIRDRIRLSPDGEIQWQLVQAHVYGPAIAGASAAEGSLDFIRSARRRGAEVTIVSHKTALANVGNREVNLQDAAREWLRDNGFIGIDALPESSLYFEDTRADKIARIVALRCTHFIDDLKEVFDDPTFPAGVERLLLGDDTNSADTPYRRYASFREIADALIAN